MLVQAIPSGPFETNAYVIACPTTLAAAIIDPAPDSSNKIARYLTSHHLKPHYLLLTHSHWDHLADVAKVAREYKIPVYVHRADAGNLMEPGSDGLPCWIAIESYTPDGYLEDGQKIPLGDLTLEVIHTPGHSPGGVCFYERNAGILMAGDTLFKGTIGNLSFPTSNSEAMWTSLKKLSTLPLKTQVFPGHGPSTTIGAESWLPNAQQKFG